MKKWAGQRATKVLDGFLGAFGIAIFATLGFLAVTQTPPGKVVLDQTLTVVTESVSKVEVMVQAVLGDELIEILRSIEAKLEPLK